MKNKIKTMKSRQLMSDDEIYRHMNFDDLLRQRNSVRKRNKKKLLGSSIVGALLIVGIAAFYFIGTPETPSATNLSVNKRTTEDKNRTFKTDSVADRAEPMVVEKPSQKKSASRPSSKPTLPSEDHKDKSDMRQQAIQSHAADVYVQAEPVDGYPQLYAWFEKSLAYPKEAIKDSIQGVVTVVFSVDESGKAQNIHIDNSLGKVFDDEVYRLMANMPRWKPATYNGHYVRGKISLPLTFEVKKVNAKK